MFAVKKKGNIDGNSQRLRVDCAQSNSLMRRPPCARLAIPAGLASLGFSAEALEDQGYDWEDFGPRTAGLDTGDVGDCFYNFVIANACSWFPIGDTVTRSEIVGYQGAFFMMKIHDAQPPYWLMNACTFVSLG